MKIWLINFLLAISVAFVGFKAYAVISTGNPLLPDTEPLAESYPKLRKDYGNITAPNEEAYESIVEHNLFSPARRELKEREASDQTAVDEEEIAAPPRGPQKIFLNGVILAGDYRAALVNDMEGRPAEKREKWVKVGDVVAGFQVTAIEKDTLRLQLEDEEYEISLFDKNKPGRRVAKARRQAGPTVVAVGETKKEPGIPKTTGKGKKETESQPSQEQATKESGSESTAKESAAGDEEMPPETEEKGLEKAKNPFVEILKRMQEQKSGEGVAEGRNPFEGLLAPNTE